jgi:hypothetical protein
MNATHLRSIREFEKLHEKYLASSNKKNVLIKKIFALETYVLHAVNNILVMATVNHNQTNRNIGEICDIIISNAKMDMDSCFITKTI